jgi:hypothetical protein
MGAPPTAGGRLDFSCPRATATCRWPPHAWGGRKGERQAQRFYCGLSGGGSTGPDSRAAATATLASGLWVRRMRDR